MRLTPGCLANYLLRTPGTPISDWRPFPPPSSPPLMPHRSVIPSAPRTSAPSRGLIPSPAPNAVIASGVCGAKNLFSFLARAGLLLLFWLVAPVGRAEYIVLQSGLRLHVTGYQLLGEKYRLQLQGGWMDVSAADVVKIEPEEVFVPIPQPPAAAPAPAANQPPYHEFVLAAASRYGVDAELISSVMEVESHFNPKAISVKNARGLMQLLPETAARLGVKDIFDPKENIDAGTRYLHDLLQLYNNDLTLALAAYNAGPDNVQKYGNVPPFRETESYVKHVKRKYQKNKTAPTTKTPAPSSPGAPSASPGPARAAPTAPAGSGTTPR